VSAWVSRRVRGWWVAGLLVPLIVGGLVLLQTGHPAHHARGLKRPPARLALGLGASAWRTLHPTFLLLPTAAHINVRPVRVAVSYDEPSTPPGPVAVMGGLLVSGLARAVPTGAPVANTISVFADRNTTDLAAGRCATRTGCVGSGTRRPSPPAWASWSRTRRRAGGGTRGWGSTTSAGRQPPGSWPPAWT
jgi:hypothetical protein